MEFLEQAEKLFNFFELNLSKTNSKLIIDFKNRYNNDYNIIGSFVKDYLTLKNNFIITKNENIFCDFIEHFYSSVKKIGQDETIKDFYQYAKCYLILIFERKFEFDEIDNEIIGYIETINLFFTMELYPYLLEKLYKFLNRMIDRKNFSIMLKFLVDIVVERNLKSIDGKINLSVLDYKISKLMFLNEHPEKRLVS